MVRHTTKKTKAKIIGHHKKEKTGKKIIISLSILIILIAIAFVSMKYIPKNTPEQNVTENITLVRVNGEPILKSFFDSQWDEIPVQTKMNMTRSQLMEQIISENLLLQKAKRENISVSDEEIDAFIKNQLQQTGVSLEQYEKILAKQGTNIDNMKAVYKKQLEVAKLFEKTVSENITSNEEEINQYYTSHKKDFLQQEQVQVKHILIQVNDNFNDSQARAEVSKIEKLLDKANNTNFCELVSNYSMDLGSKDKCGEYTFQRGMMVPEFENASFDMKDNERRTIKSSYGYHIILKIKTIPEGYLGLEDKMMNYPNQPTVKNMIVQTIEQNKARAIFDKYIKQLRKDAKIEYLDEELKPITG